MLAAVKPYLTAGLALLSVGAVTAPPIEGIAVTESASAERYRLTAASAGLVASAVAGSEATPANVPGNLLALVLNIPAWEVQAMNRFADAMVATGSWQVWGPTNVFGFDEQDPPKLEALLDMTVPVQPFSAALGEQLSWWARANFPMNAGCAARPGACPDLGALLDVTAKVSTAQLYDGYQFPTVTNPFNGEPTSWSGQYVKLDPGAPFTALADYLTGPAATVETVSLGEFVAAFGRVVQSVSDAFNPFVPNSEWFNPEQTGLAEAFRAFAPSLCPTCDPEKPYDNPWLYDNYPARSAPAASAAVAATSIPGAAVTAVPDSVVAELTDVADEVNGPVFAEVPENSTADEAGPTPVQRSDRSDEAGGSNRSTAARRGLRASGD